MIRVAVNIDKPHEMPLWAVNFFKYYAGVYYAMQSKKKSKRCDVFSYMMEEGVFPKEIKNLYFNKRGDAVFYWNTSGDRLFFLLRWSS